MKEHVKSEDIYRLYFVSSPQITPGADKIIYVKKRADKKDKCYYSNLHCIHIQSKKDTDFTFYGKHLDSMPRISPNGRQLLFLRVKDGQTSLRTISMYGGESREICDLPNGKITNIKFSRTENISPFYLQQRKNIFPMRMENRRSPYAVKFMIFFTGLTVTVLSMKNRHSFIS